MKLKLISRESRLREVDANILTLISHDDLIYIDKGRCCLGGASFSVIYKFILSKITCVYLPLSPRVLNIEKTTV